MQFTKKFYLIIPIVTCAITLTAVYATGTMETFTAPWQLKDSSNNQTRMYVDSSGNVGVGTTNPQVKLDVNGQTHIGNDLILTRSDNFPTAAIVADNSVTTGIDISKTGGGNLNGIRLWANTLYASGNVGVGTTSPAQKLDVSGNIGLAGNIVGESSSTLKIIPSTNQTICIGSGC